MWKMIKAVFAAFITSTRNRNRAIIVIWGNMKITTPKITICIDTYAREGGGSKVINIFHCRSMVWICTKHREAAAAVYSSPSIHFQSLTYRNSQSHSTEQTQAHIKMFYVLTYK